jgi:hypothetical protein
MTMTDQRGLEPPAALDLAAETPLQRATCKWLGVATAALFGVVGVLAFMVPAEFYNAAVQFELWHAVVTAALLLVGSRGSRLGRFLGGMGIALGVIYLAPVLFLTGMVFLMPEGMEVAFERVGGMLAYCAALLTYYGVALALVRRANLAAKPAPRA